MRLIGKLRFSIGAIMMFILMVATGAALFVKIQQNEPAVIIPLDWGTDVPSLFLLAIALTAVALGSWKEHSAIQIMLQVTLACFGCLTLIWISEAQYERAIRYWCQATFAASVTLPMLARRYVKSSFPRGPRRDSWKKTSEAVFFSFMTMMLITLGALFQAGVYLAATNLMSVTGSPLSPPAIVVPAPGSPIPPTSIPPTLTPPSLDPESP